MMAEEIQIEKKIGIFSVGTAGHVLPGVRIVNELINLGFDQKNLVVVTGSRNERKYYNKLDIEVIEQEFIRTSKSSLYYLANVFRLLKSLYLLNRIIKKNNISLIFSTGAYIAPLASLIGYFKRIPIYLQEQNIYGGLGNYVGSFFAKKVYTSFPDTQNLRNKSIDFVGPILDSSIESAIEDDSSTLPKKINENISIGVQGGSQGSEEINDLIYNVFNNWDGNEIKLTHITGGLKVKDINNSKIKYIKVDFIDEMTEYYKSIQLQITRGGGGILESASLGIVNIIVPYRYGTTATHQKENAMYLVKNRAAELLNDVNENELNELIGKYISSVDGEEMSVGMGEITELSFNAKESVKKGARKLIAKELVDEYTSSL